MTTLRKDLNLIADLVENNSKVIDVGCGNGELINFLSKNKNAKIQGLEINQKKVISDLASSAPIDHDKVSSIKKAISSGNYPLDLDKISDALMEAYNDMKS